MKKVFLIIALPVCLVIGQEQPELPGWGVYVGAGMVGASGDSLSGTTSTLTVPSFGISKGVMLGGMPLFVGLGVHPRGFKNEDEGLEWEVNANFLDVWAVLPYPVGPAFLQVGFLAGVDVGGTQKVAIDFYGMTISDEGDTELGLDYGLLAGLGVPLGPVNLNLFYVQGMADHDGITFNGMGANLGYSF